MKPLWHDGKLPLGRLGELFVHRDSYNVEDDIIEAALKQAARKIGGE